MSDGQENKQGFDMTTETKAYLDAHFQRLEEKITAVTNPILKTIEDHRNNFLEIYTRLGKVETDVAILKDNKGSRQSNSGTILIVIGLVLTAILAAIGWLR